MVVSTQPRYRPRCKRSHEPVDSGDDADTIGAIFGQIAGAHYGAESIPAE